MTEPSAESSAELFSKTSEMDPNGLNIPMYESWRIRSDIFPVTRFSGKHGILDGIPRNFFKSLKTDSKGFQMVQTYPSMSLRTFVSVFKLGLHNLENTKFFDGIPYNMLINSITTFYSTV